MSFHVFIRDHAFFSGFVVLQHFDLKNYEHTIFASKSRASRTSQTDYIVFVTPPPLPPPPLFQSPRCAKMRGSMAGFLVEARAANQKTTGSLSGALRTRVDLFHPWPCQRVVLLNFASSKLCKMKDPSAAVALLRGIPLSAVLSRGSKLFQNSKGSAKTYELSVPADHFNCFISHTWKTARWNTQRWKKHMALRLQFTFVGAYALAFLVGVLVVVLGALQLLPVVETVATDRIEESRSPCGTLAVSVVCHIALNGACSPEALKNRGIENLSMFIFFSWDFVVLCTKSFLQRLLTVYELAGRHPSSLSAAGRKKAYCACLSVLLSVRSCSLSPT